MDLFTYALLKGLIYSIPKGEDGASISSVEFKIDSDGNLQYKVILTGEE